MKRVLILLLFVLVAGCADTGPDSDWECPSCGWGVGEHAQKCPNCSDTFRSNLYPQTGDYRTRDGVLIPRGGTVERGHVPVKR